MSRLYVPPPEFDELTERQRWAYSDFARGSCVTIYAWADETKTDLLVTADGGQARITPSGAVIFTETHKRNTDPQPKEQHA